MARNRLLRPICLCETDDLTLPIDVDEVVGLTHLSRSTSQNICCVSGTQFCQRLSRPQNLVRMEGLDKLAKFKYFIWSQTRYLSPCSIMP
jgi:hypothetical protein